jgi:hypothetical protein
MSSKLDSAVSDPDSEYNLNHAVVLVVYLSRLILTNRILLGSE